MVTKSTSTLTTSDAGRLGKLVLSCELTFLSRVCEVAGGCDASRVTARIEQTAKRENTRCRGFMISLQCGRSSLPSNQLRLILWTAFRFFTGRATGLTRAKIAFTERNS